MRANDSQPDDWPATHLCQKVLDVPAGQQSAVFDDAHAVADVGQLGQDVAGNKNRLAKALQPTQEITHLDSGTWVEAAGGFVEEQHLRVVQEHASQAQSLRHSSRKTRDKFVSLHRQIH